MRFSEQMEVDVKTHVTNISLDVLTIENQVVTAWMGMLVILKLESVVRTLATNVERMPSGWIVQGHVITTVISYSVVIRVKFVIFDVRMVVAVRKGLQEQLMKQLRLVSQKVVAFE